MSGQVNGVWVVPGTVLEVDDENGRRYIELGYAEEVKTHKRADDPGDEQPREERAVAQAPETATQATPGVAEPPKRGPGRPRK